MADTQKSLTDLQTLLADNTTAGISPQDLRDFLVSALGGYGQIHMTGATGVTIPGAYAKFAQFTANGSYSGCTVDHTNDQITVPVTGVYDISFDTNLDTAGGNTVASFTIAVNGTPVSANQSVEVFTTSTGKVLSLRRLVACNANDVITVQWAGTVSTTLDINSATLVVTRVS